MRENAVLGEWDRHFYAKTHKVSKREEQLDHHSFQCLKIHPH